MNHEEIKSLKTQFNRVCDDSFFVSDAITAMRGLSILLDEFNIGSFANGINSSNELQIEYITKRIADIIEFSVNVLTDTAENLDAGICHFQSEVFSMFDSLDDGRETDYEQESD